VIKTFAFLKDVFKDKNSWIYLFCRIINSFLSWFRVFI